MLSYLFHRIKDRLDGSPTLLIIDGGWLALDDPGLAGQLREWLKTLRKKNASVVFAMQSLSDIDGSPSKPACAPTETAHVLLYRGAFSARWGALRKALLHREGVLHRLMNAFSEHVH